MGGYRVQGRGEAPAKAILDDAKALQDAGVFALVLELVPMELAAKVTQALKVPTIGIGAGPHCDGQVLVAHDAFGLFEDFRPRFVKPYADLAGEIRAAAEAYCREVREGMFPDQEHSFR